MTFPCTGLDAVCCQEVVPPRVRMALWGTGCSRQNRCRAGPGPSADCRTGPTTTMDREPTAQHWLIRATKALRRVTNAESRFSASLSVNEVTMLAAADELEAATREAAVWVGANPCPDPEVGGRVTLMLHTCTEVAVTASGPSRAPTPTSRRSSAAWGTSWPSSTSTRRPWTPGSPGPNGARATPGSVNRSEDQPAREDAA